MLLIVENITYCNSCNFPISRFKHLVVNFSTVDTYQINWNQIYLCSRQKKNKGDEKKTKKNCFFQLSPPKLKRGKTETISEKEKDAKEITIIYFYINN